MSLPRYKCYVASGVKWLGEVPGHWKVKPNKAFLEPRKSVVGTTWTEKTLLSLTLNGVIPRDTESGKGKFPSDFGTYQEVAENDLVFCLFDIDETPRTVGLAPSKGMITGAYDVFHCKAGTEPRFVLYYYLYIDSHKGLRPFYTGLRKVVRPPTFMAVKLALPPIQEQTQIADFLDHETAKIDALIAEQRRLIGLLKEKRQAVISHAVTKGLDPDVSMKPAGIEWLGDIPGHWDVFPLKRDLDFLTSGSRGWAENYADEGELFIRIGNLTRESIHLDLSDIQRVAVPQGTEGSRTKVQPGDVLFSITAYLGSVAIVPESLESAYVSQHVALARLRKKCVIPKWAGYMALSYVGKTWFETQSYGGTKIQLSLDDVRDLPLPVPPISEQCAIVYFIEAELQVFDTLTAEAQRAIDLLQERRTALISAAVTGQIDVRGLAEAEAA